MFSHLAPLPDSALEVDLAPERELTLGLEYLVGLASYDRSTPEPLAVLPLRSLLQQGRFQFNLHQTLHNFLRENILSRCSICFVLKNRSNVLLCRSNHAV